MIRLRAAWLWCTSDKTASMTMADGTLPAARPSNPAFSNRDDQIETVRIDVFMCAATSSIFIPSRRSRIVSARNQSRCQVECHWPDAEAPP